VAPVFAAHRDAGISGYYVRLVLSDLCQIDISAAPPEPPCGTAQATGPGLLKATAEAVAGIMTSFRSSPR
jgi:hypothetical protein